MYLGIQFFPLYAFNKPCPDKGKDSDRNSPRKADKSVASRAESKPADRAEPETKINKVS